MTSVKKNAEYLDNQRNGPVAQRKLASSFRLIKYEG